MNQQESCKTCRFAGPQFNFEDHECRRRSPVILLKHDVNYSLYTPKFPIVRSTDWCGEYEPKLEDTP